MRRKQALLASAAGVAVALVAAAGSYANQPAGSGRAGGTTELKIGFSGALSGAYAAYDAPLLNGMKFAAKEINAKGGLGGFTIKIVSKDNKGDQTQTATTTQELLDQGIKIFVITTGDTAVAGGQLAVQGGAIASVGGNTAPEIVKSVGKRGFMIVFGDNVQASAGAQYACGTGYRKAYVIGSPEIPYTKFIPRYFEDAFRHDCQGKVTSKDTYKIGSTDFGTQVTKIQNANPKPDVIYTSMFVPDFGVFMKQLRSAGVKTPVVTVDGNDSTLLVDSAGTAVNGVVYTTSAYPVKNNLDAQFVKAYKKQTGKSVESNTLEAIGRDNIYVIAAAAAKAKSGDPNKILAQVYKLKHFKLATGELTMDPVGQVPTKEVFLVRMKGKQFTFLTSFTPKYIAKA
jgi:branched-chain amino acid transport system substrate-binding protein